MVVQSGEADSQDVVVRVRPQYLAEHQLERTLPHQALAEWGAVYLHPGCHLLVTGLSDWFQQHHAASCN